MLYDFVTLQDSYMLMLEKLYLVFGTAYMFLYYGYVRVMDIILG